VKFAAIIEYTPDKAKIAAIRPQHRQYLTSLRERGRLAVAGPFADDSGGLLVYEAGSREEAEQLVRDDPFQQNGIFVRYQLRPWNVVFFTPSSFT
jgi:uncharacterized protein YciI